MLSYIVHLTTIAKYTFATGHGLEGSMDATTDEFDDLLFRSIEQQSNVLRLLSGSR